MKRNLIFGNIFLAINMLLFDKLYAQEQKAVILREFIFDSASFAQCHASTITEISDGLAAAWFGGTAEKNPDVEIWFSRKLKNKKWTDPVSIANGIQSDTRRYPCWNPVLFRVPNGPLLLFYKAGPSPDRWWGEMKVSKDDGLSWSESIKLPEHILGPIKDKPVLLNNGTLLCGSSTENNGWQIHFEMTRDWGNAWTNTGPINKSGKIQVIQPTLLKYPGNRLQALCRSKEGVIMNTWSEDNGKSWSELKPTILPNPNSGIDAVTLNNGEQLLVYNRSTNSKGKDGGPRTPLNVAVSKNGIDWRDVAILENKPGEFSYPAVIQTSDGLVHITYTWKRKRIMHVVLDPAYFQ